MKIELPDDVAYIISVLENAGYEAYAVGGCVRDSILGREPDDWDITTSAKPPVVKSLFAKTIDTGLKHGTVTVLSHHTGYEVTTYRIDGEYEDARHPSSIEYTNDLKTDLMRRDFTINAMAYSDKKGLVDIFGGMDDLEKGIIRCVGEAGDRFDEDALRMMRAVRFAAQLGFSIAPDTEREIYQRAGKLSHISAERIRVELTKLVMGKDAGMLREAYLTGMTAIFLPEFDKTMKLDQQNPHHIFTVGEHTIRSIEVMNFFFGRKAGEWDASIVSDEVMGIVREFTAGMTKKQEKILCLTMLFHDLGKAETKTVDENGIGHFYTHAKVSEQIVRKRMRVLTFDNETLNVVEKLVKVHDRVLENKEPAMRRAISKIGEELMPMLFLVKFCDAYAQNPEFLKEKTDSLMQTIGIWKKMVQAGDAFSLKDLAIDGKELIDMGLKPGPEIGAVLKELLDRVLENPLENEKSVLKKMVEEKIIKMRTDE